MNVHFGSIRMEINVVQAKLGQGGIATALLSRAAVEAGHNTLRPWLASSVAYAKFLVRTTLLREPKRRLARQDSQASIIA